MSTTRPVLPIALEKYESIIHELGFTLRSQSGYHRIDGPTGRRMYVANTKTVRRIDLSGFEVEKMKKEKVFGRVTGQLDLDPTLGEEGILNLFRDTLKHMLTLPPEVKEAKPKAPKAENAKSTSSVPSSPEDKEAVEAKRRELIARVAAEKGVAVSAKAFVAQASE